MTAETVAEEMAENITDEVTETEIVTVKMAETEEQGVISAKSVWELFIGVKKVCDKICQKLQYKVLFMAKIALNKSYGGNNG